MNGNLWYLRRCGLFDHLTPEQASHLDRQVLVRTYRRHAIIYSPTDSSQEVLVLTSGRVKIKDITPDGKETILAFIQAGEVFGELAVIGGEPRREYAEAMEDCRVLVLPRDALLWLIEQRPDVALSFTRLVGVRRQRIETRLGNLLFLPSRQRIVRMILELAESHGERLGNRCEIHLPLSHQELAGLVGVTRETVTVTLGQLQAEGLIRVQRRHIQVADYEGLVAEASETAAPPSGPHRRHAPLYPPEAFQAARRRRSC